jgi:hypothetical protein
MVINDYSILDIGNYFISGYSINGSHIGEYSVNLSLLTTNTLVVRFDPLMFGMEANTPTIKPPHLL